MKKINLNLVANDSDKKIAVSGKLYFWERVECIITGLDVKSVSTVRAAIYDGETQVVAAVNFQSAGFNTIYCEFPLQTEELQAALSETSPNAKKQFTLYIWDQYEEEMVAVGNIPIYNNPYIEDETFKNITVLSNFRVQYSGDGGETWSEDVPARVSHIRLSVDGGATWQDKIFISNVVVDADGSNSCSTSDDYGDLDLDTSYVVVKSEDGVNYNVPLSQLEKIIGPTITIYN